MVVSKLRTKQGCVDVTGAAHRVIYSILSYTYVHLLVLISHLIAQCTIVDHLKLFLIAFVISVRPYIFVSEWKYWTPTGRTCIKIDIEGFY
jgi:hypothetical protein